MVKSRKWHGWRASLAVLACAPALMGGVCAVPSAAQEVVQPMPHPATRRLNDALRRLATNPVSLPALVAAGRASLELDDVDAAQGFFSRAQAVDGEDGRVLAGLAIVALRQEDPVTALSLFEQARVAGEDLRAYAADHGLAHDLVGNNERAQQLYGVALARSENPEMVRRLALSHAISGDQAASEAILLPLLQRRDLAAYRTRAFALAILGREDEAVAIAETMLPPRLARRMAPYLRYMPRLTPAQQAAAANLGSFPRAADIGREDPQLARAASGNTGGSAAAQAASRLVPAGPPMGAGTRDASRDEQPTRLVEAMAGMEDGEPAASEPVVVARLEGPAPAAAPPPAATATQQPRPMLTLPRAEEPAASELPQLEEEAEEDEVSLAEAFSGFTLEAEGPPPPASGAVDITTFEPVREEPAPPPPPAHPRRHWVQVATGRNVSAFRFDWRRLVRESGGLLEGHEPYRARWNSTNRLVTGPFDSANEAQEFVTALGQQGISAFRFTSAEGQAVVPVN